MKRAMGLVFFLLVLGAMAFACAEDAETFTCGDYTYTLNEDGSAVISGYSGKDEALTIPSELDGHPERNWRQGFLLWHRPDLGHDSGQCD